MLAVFAVLQRRFFVQRAQRCGGNTGICPGRYFKRRRDNASRQILLNIRLPRAIVAALVGMNLAVSGAVLQAVMKNPLADPHIIGISSGAGLAGIFVIVLFPALEYLIVPTAFCGAMLAAACIYILAWKNGIRPLRIVLAGVARIKFSGRGYFGHTCALQRQGTRRADVDVGGLAARSWPHVEIILPYAVIGFILAVCGARYLNILQLGDDVAKGLGVNVELVRLVFTAIGALLGGKRSFRCRAARVCGAYCSAYGAAFNRIGLPLFNSVVCTFGHSRCNLQRYAGPCGFAPLELPVGIFMAALGAPFFLFLLRKEL